MDANGVRTTDLDRLLERLRQGDPAARGEVIDRVYDRLMRLTRRMMRAYPAVSRWSEPDDVLQGAMLRLHRSLGYVYPDSSREFFGLAATQIRRELIDLARHHYGRNRDIANQQTRRDALFETSLDTTGEPSGLIDWTNFHEQVDRLPASEHEIFVLLWYEGRTQPEAAELLGISLATLKRRWQSARLHLRDALKGAFPLSD